MQQLTWTIASFGTVSKLYGNLSDKVEAEDIIAGEFGTVNRSYLPSWITKRGCLKSLF
jgi:hypothetical protein